MAKSKKPAARKSGSTAGSKSAAKKTAASAGTSAAAKASDAAEATASSASKAASEAKASASKTVSPSEMKKELEAKAKPMPEVAKEAPATFDSKEASAETPIEPQAEKPKPVETAVETKASAPVASEPAPSRGGFFPLVLGGVIAAGLGYFASEFDLFGTRGSSDDLRATVQSQDSRLSALESAEPAPAPEVNFPELDSLTAEVQGSVARLEELSGEISGLSEQLGALDTRVSDIEKRPITDGDDQAKAAVAAYERELAALQASVEEQRAEIEGLLDNALSVEQATAETARLANVQGALTELTSALGAGEPFEAALTTLVENGVADVPAALSDVAADGVQTLTALQSAFPDNARASLSAARASGTNDEGEAGFGGFLRRQLGARSVTPREGDGPDAVLSRAEAAVREGRLSDALGELDVLPEPAQAAMQDWLDAARARDAAQSAAQDLSQSLTAN